MWVKVHLKDICVKNVSLFPFYLVLALLIRYHRTLGIGRDSERSSSPVMLFSVSNSRKWRKGYKVIRMKDCKFFNRHGQIIVLNMHKQQKFHNGSDNRKRTCLSGAKFKLKKSGWNWCLFSFIKNLERVTAGCPAVCSGACYILIVSLRNKLVRFFILFVGIFVLILPFLLDLMAL